MTKPTMLRHNPHSRSTRLLLMVTGTLLGFLGYRALSYPATTNLSSYASSPLVLTGATEGGTLEHLPVPPEYAGLFGSPDGHQPTKPCDQEFGTKHLDKLRNQATEYCSSKSSGSLTCFHASATDSLCLARDVQLLLETENFALDCEMTHDPRTPSQSSDVLDKLQRQF